MNEHIHYFDKKDFYEECFKFLSRYSSSKYSIYKNNNDTLKILLSAFFYLKSFILSLYNCSISYISSMHQFIYKLQFILLLIVFLFSFVMTFEENSQISTNLLISAYFKKNALTRISYDMIEDEQKVIENQNINLNNINFDDLNKLIRDKINKDKKENIDSLDNTYSCQGDTIHFDNKDFKCNDKNIYNKIKTKEELLDEFKSRISSNIKNPHKTETLKVIASKSNDNFFLYYNSLKYILINCLSFFVLYIFIKFTLNSKIKGSLLFNIFCIFISFNLLYSSYKNELYLTSNFFFILLIYINKNLIDSVYLKLKFKRKDFEIMSTSLMAFDFRQFHLKCIVLLNVTILSGILSIFFFKSFLNYITFYICLFTLIVFLSNCIEPIIPYYLKPIKNIIIFTAGIINFFLSKLILRIFISENYLLKQTNYFRKYINNYDIIFKDDSLYFVSDLFSFFCFDYIREYFDFQINISLLIDNFLDNNNNDEILKNKLQKEALNQFGGWILFLWISMLIGVIGIFKKEFICLIMCIYLIKILMNYFCNLYDPKLSKFLFYIHSFLFLFANVDISNNENTYLINLFYSFTSIDKDIISFIIRLITLLFIVYYIIVINLILYNSYSDKCKYENEIKSIKKDNQDINIYHIEIEKVPIGKIQKLFKYIGVFLDCFINYIIICIIIKIYNNYEKYIILKIIYAILSIIFHVIKTSNINKINNTLEYMLNFFIWFFFSIRIINLSNSVLSLIFFINHINLLILIIYYFLNEKRNIISTFIIFFCLIIGYYHLNSYIFLIDAIISITALILINIINININDNNENDDGKNSEEKEKNEELGNMNVYNSLSLLFLLPILLFFLLQLKFQNYFNFLNNIDRYIKEFMVRMYILYDGNYKKNVIKEEPVEFVVITYFIDALKLISGNY